MAAFVPNLGNGEISFQQEHFYLPIDIYQHRKFEIGIPTHDLYSWQSAMTYKILQQWLLG